MKMRDEHRHHAGRRGGHRPDDSLPYSAASPQWDFNREERFPSPWDGQGIGREAFARNVKDSIESIRVSQPPSAQGGGSAEQ